MTRRIALAPELPRQVFANPVPLGLLGLAIGCAALVPSAFGHGLTVPGFKTAAVFALLFGAGCQLLAGVMSLANHNLLSGTVFSAFAFLWVVNGWTLQSIAQGVIPDPAVVLATEIVLLIIFLGLSYAFAFYSTLLFVFLIDIDLLFAVRIAGTLTHAKELGPVVGVLTIVLAAISLWLAFGVLINPAAGRAVFPIGGALLRPAAGTPPPWALRRAVVEQLHARWLAQAFAEAPLAELREALAARPDAARLPAELAYLEEAGAVIVRRSESGEGVAVRITAVGIEQYEQQPLVAHG
jgi:hypothetical protein